VRTCPVPEHQGDIAASHSIGQKGVAVSVFESEFPIARTNGLALRWHGHRIAKPLAVLGKILHS